MILSKKMSYLCIMKNENDMDTILKAKGFIPGENPNEYVRRTWTIRIDGDYLEAFTSTLTHGFYPFVRIKNEGLFDLLEDIEVFEE